MKVDLNDTDCLKVKVIHQGQILRSDFPKLAVIEALVFHKHMLFLSVVIMIIAEPLSIYHFLYPHKLIFFGGILESACPSVCPILCAKY